MCNLAPKMLCQNEKIPHISVLVRTLRPHRPRNKHTHTVAPCAASSTLCLWLKQQRSWPLEMPTVPAHLSNSKSLSNSTCELQLNTPCPPVRPEGGADQTLTCPMAEPSVLLLGPGPGGHAWPPNPCFSDHRPDPGVWGRGWRLAKPVNWMRRSHQCGCCQTPPLKRWTTSQGGCVSTYSHDYSGLSQHLLLGYIL